MACNINSVKEKCSGCALCAAICPLNAIKIVVSSEGFRYPCIDKNKCINCGKCLRRCPIVNDFSLRKPINTYVGVGNKYQEISRSTSGGAFYYLARHFLEYLDGFVCGAVIDLTTFSVYHTLTNSIADLIKFQNSKYAQSDIKECYHQIESVVDSNPVLFCGTPCQVAAMKEYFKGRDQNLFLVDIVCHGVPSPLFFSDYIKEQYEVKNLSDFTFRKKSKTEITSYCYTFYYQDGKEVTVPSYIDPYYNAFMEGFSFRESCYKCKFAIPNRVGDITLGDCGDRKKYYKLEKGRTLSDVLINTEKGEKLWLVLKKYFDYAELDYEREIRMNKQLSRPAYRPALRDYFYTDYDNLSINEFANKYAPPKGLGFRVKKFIKVNTPATFRTMLEMLVRAIIHKPI